MDQVFLLQPPVYEVILHYTFRTLEVDTVYNNTGDLEGRKGKVLFSGFPITVHN